MIPHFPDPYPGEAFYSVYARFCERLGLDKNFIASRFFFGKSCEISVQLPHRFDHVVSNLPPGHSYTADQLIDEHTLLPFFAPFIDSARYQQAKSEMRGNGGAGIRLRLGLGAKFACQIGLGTALLAMRRTASALARPSGRDFIKSPGSIFAQFTAVFWNVLR